MYEYLKILLGTLLEGSAECVLLNITSIRRFCQGRLSPQQPWCYPPPHSHVSPFSATPTSKQFLDIVYDVVQFYACSQ